MVPVVLTGTREGTSTRINSRAAPATLRLHLDVSIPRRAQDCYVAKNAFASAPRQLTSCLAAPKEPCAHIKHEHLAIPRGMSPDRSPQRRPALTYITVKDGDDLSDRLGNGHCCICPASCDARAVLRAHPRALLPPKRLDGAHEAIRAYFTLYGSYDPNCLLLAYFYAAS